MEWFKNVFGGTLGAIIALNSVWVIPLLLIILSCCACMLVSMISVPTA